ncbi:3-oxoacyl-ACP reductase FabG [Promicromonospora panici]|uniref:3-oxoacyl-ACP reductase FabG n=1 Tax=Promicromonospora panici TaxID=2219658 RepID=UPI00101BEE61|nr:3-oxoacyl-ACP reductase FabG [Promicromonospora panici]
MMKPRTVLVTGGNRGIGRGIAEAFLRDGHRVAVISRNGNGPDGALAVRADMAESGSIDQAFSVVEAQLGGVEVLVSNAGITRDGPIAQMSDEDFADVININLNGSYRVVKRASRGMMRRRFGRIILISSINALAGAAGQVNYASSKAGLVGLARSLTRELAPRGITANVISPTLIATDMTSSLSPATVDAYQRATPVGRLGTVDDVAGAALWLASDSASFVTGAVIPVDGGAGMGH